MRYTNRNDGMRSRCSSNRSSSRQKEAGCEWLDNLRFPRNRRRRFFMSSSSSASPILVDTASATRPHHHHHHHHDRERERTLFLRETRIYTVNSINQFTGGEYLHSGCACSSDSASKRHINSGALASCVAPNECCRIVPILIVFMIPSSTAPTSTTRKKSRARALARSPHMRTNAQRAYTRVHIIYMYMRSMYTSCKQNRFD